MKADAPNLAVGPPLVLTKAQVGKLLTVPPATIENLHRLGVLVGVKVGKHLRWKFCDVTKFAAELVAEK